MWKGAIHTEFQYQTNPLDTILIIDDDEINRGILGNLFSPFYTILEAENGRSGLEILLGHQAELCAVLLDVVMPNMSGLEVLRHLNQDGISSQIPIFLITAEAHDAIMKEAYELGVMDVISKPIIPYVVERRVNSVVELFQARKRLENVAEQQPNFLSRQLRSFPSVWESSNRSPPPSNSAAENPENTFAESTILPATCSSIQSLETACRKRPLMILPWRQSCTM